MFVDTQNSNSEKTNSRTSSPLMSDDEIVIYNSLYGLPSLQEVNEDDDEEVVYLNPLYVERKDFITKLPEEILLYIISYFDSGRDLIKLAMVNTVTHFWIQHPSYEMNYIWRNLCQYNFDIKNQRLLPSSQTGKRLSLNHRNLHWKGVFKEFHLLQKKVDDETYRAREYKLVMVGSSGVGKSALTIRFVRGEFAQYWDPTIEDSYRKKCIVDGNVVEIDILDTAALHYSNTFHHYYRTGQAFIICFSVIDKKSFEEVVLFYDFIMRFQEEEDKETPILLVGNKIDMRIQRVVTKEDALQLAKKLNCVYVETSAKNNENVTHLFYESVRRIEKSPPGEYLYDKIPFMPVYIKPQKRKCNVM